RWHPLPPNSELNEGERAMFDKLNEKFDPSELVVRDTSGGCGSFYDIRIASVSFKGLSMVKQHRMVTEALKQEIGEIHGLNV
ncbi:bola protein, partial [Pterulicium gracile]